MPVRVLVVDDHPVVRAGIVGYLAFEPDLEVVGEACDGEAAVHACREVSPDVVVMDVRMPVLDGVAATREVVALGAKVLVVTSFDAQADVDAALGAGAGGYVLKNADRQELVAAVRAVASGEAPGYVARPRTDVQAQATLSPRESEVLALVARGYTNAEIGRELYIVEATVKTHLMRAFAKLGVDDRTRAVVVALDRGMLRLT